MKKQQIEQLIGRFFDGKTTRNEEQQLYDFFRSPDIPAHLRPYASTFLSLSARQQPVPEAFAKPFVSRWTVAASIAIVFCLSVAAATITYHVVVEKQNTSESYGHSKNSESSEHFESSEVFEEILLPDTLVFKNQTLAEIAKEMMVIYDCKVELADQATADLRLYFTLPKGSTVEDFVTIIDEYETLVATIKDNVITIKKQEAER